MHHDKELSDTKTVFYGFSTYSEYRKFNSLEQSVKAKSIYTFEETLGYWENIGYKNQKLAYSIFNEKGEKVDKVIALYEKSSHKCWELIGPSVEMNEYFQVINIYFKIKDPFGSKGSFHFGSGQPGIANAMNYLHSASRYFSKAQHEFELYQELRRIKGISLEPLP